MHTTTTTHTQGHPHTPNPGETSGLGKLFMGLQLGPFPLQNRMTNCLVSGFETMAVFKSKPILPLLLRGRVPVWQSFQRGKLQRCGARGRDSVFPFFLLFFPLSSPRFLACFIPAGPSGTPLYLPSSSKETSAPLCAGCSASQRREVAPLLHARRASPALGRVAPRNTLISLPAVCRRA